MKSREKVCANMFEISNQHYRRKMNNNSCVKGINKPVNRKIVIEK